MSSRLLIPILALGKHRDIAKAIGNVLVAQGFPINGILTTQLCSSASLALALRVLEPRPQALLIGGGYSDAEAADAHAVFYEYANEVGMLEGTVVVVRHGVAMRDGVAMWVIGELKAHFEARTASQGFVDRVLAM